MLDLNRYSVTNQSENKCRSTARENSPTRLSQFENPVPRGPPRPITPINEPARKNARKKFK